MIAGCHHFKMSYFTLLKTSHGTLIVYLSSYHAIDHRLNIVGVCASENSREAQILQCFGSFFH